MSKGNDKNRKKSKDGKKPSSKDSVKSGSGSSGSKKNKCSSSKAFSGSKKTVASSSRASSRNKSVGVSIRRPTSISSLASQYNVVPGRYKANSDASASGVIKQKMEANRVLTHYGALLSDTVMLYLVCPTHNKMALSLVDGKGQFVPFGPIKTGQSWREAVNILAGRVLNLPENTLLDQFFSHNLVIDVLRTQMPIYYDFITRVSYLMKLNSEGCHQHCRDNNCVAWYPIGDIDKSFSRFEYAGPEPKLLKEYEAERNHREVTMIDVLELLNDEGKQSVEAELLKICAMNEEDIVKLYGDFLQHCYPSEFMTLHTFKSYLKKTGLKLCNEVSAIFRAFDSLGQGYFNFHQFVLGLAIISSLTEVVAEQSTVNTQLVDDTPPKPSKEVANIQADFVFHYFAEGDRDHLTADELQTVTSKCKLPPKDMSVLKSSLKYDKLAKQSFTKLVAKLLHDQANSSNKMAKHFSMSSVFPTAAQTPLAYLRLNPGYPAINMQQTASSRVEKIRAKLKNRLLCENCRAKKYHLSTYTVKLSSDGLMCEPLKNEQSDTKNSPKDLRVKSERNFARKFICNQLMDMIRKFADSKGIFTSKVKLEVPDWDKPEVRKSFVPKIIKLLNEAREVFAKGERVIKVTSPCYVIGDIHGNLHDLLLFDKLIWRLGPYFSTANLLFLGDYVDRGDYSVECILYLLSMKLLAPDHVRMLRGNHETRALQIEHTFLNEVNQKFGADANQMFEAFNEVFDVMPLVAIVDESIYCAHGGIPSFADKVEQIAAVKSPLRDPDNECQIAMEVLWNDPITDREYQDLKANNKEVANNATNAQRGFLTNTKRGTGSYYSEKALDNFLAGNGLSHVIRAHECIPAGYAFHAGGRCITIFSCSNYCGQINEAAVALVHDCKIRVVKVDNPTRS